MRNKTIKKSAYFILEKYHNILTLDFQINKKLCDEVTIISSKGLRNKIAGYTTHLIKKINAGITNKLYTKIIEKNVEFSGECELSLFIETKNILFEIDIEAAQMLDSIYNYYIETIDQITT